jgi:hypothetical protein
MLKDFANVCLLADSRVFRLCINSPKRKAVVMSRVRQKKRGCKPITPPSFRILLMRLSTASLNISRLAYYLK